MSGRIWISSPTPDFTDSMRRGLTKRTLPPRFSMARSTSIGSAIEMKLMCDTPGFEPRTSKYSVCSKSGSGMQRARTEHALARRELVAAVLRAGAVDLPRAEPLEERPGAGGNEGVEGGRIADVDGGAPVAVALA